MTDSVNKKAANKAEGALLSIGELAEKIGVPTHVLRYWETRFPQLKPLQRSGRRRYYRTEDVALVTRIHELLHVQGYTVDGARKALSSRAGRKSGQKVDAQAVDAVAAAITPAEAEALAQIDMGAQPLAIGGQAEPVAAGATVPVEKLVGLRDRLEAALN